MATLGLALAPRRGCGSPIPLVCKISEARRKRRPYTVCGYDFIKTAPETRLPGNGRPPLDARLPRQPTASPR